MTVTGTGGGGKSTNTAGVVITGADKKIKKFLCARSYEYYQRIY